ncbi:MAG: class I SAM-dependent methyltransferase [Lachnospiraceae bacterium]|nr:class I SAM-dependent methyltransferase [Lachnospiraceae bacterium]
MYNDFAQIYDSFMDNVPYDAWCEQITAIFRTYGISSGIVADLGCGTGTLTEMLADRGFDMIGIDNSDDMLMEALRKRDESGHDILYLNQDMREFELYGTCAAIVSRCDSLNYITEPDDLIKVFELVNNYLDPKGLFIFDMKTEYMFRSILGNNTFSRSNDEATYIWENYYDGEKKLNEYDLTMFIRNGGMFEKSEETHIQRAYSIEEIKNAAAAAGLKWLGVWDADTETDPEEDSARIIVVLQENGK